MKNSWILALQFSFLGLAPNAFSQALEETTALLNNPGARDDAIKGDPAAQSADQNVKALGLNAAGQAKIYDISSHILERLSTDNGGDVSKMNDQVSEMVRDPSSLQKLLTPEQAAQIHELATQTQGTK
jgi:hypothetical protein